MPLPSLDSWLCQEQKASLEPISRWAEEAQLPRLYPRGATIHWGPQWIVVAMLYPCCSHVVAGCFTWVHDLAAVEFRFVVFLLTEFSKTTLEDVANQLSS